MEPGAVEQLALHSGEEASASQLRRPWRCRNSPRPSPSTVPRPIGGSVHRRPTTCTGNLVGVMDDRGGASLSHRHVQRVEDQFGAQMVGHRPPHHPAAEHIEYNGQIQESRRSRDVGDISDPQPVRGLGLEATLDQVPARGGPGGHDAWCAAPCDDSPRPSLPHASPERPACGSPACPQRPAPRESSAPRTSHGCVRESLARARSAPRQRPRAPSAHGYTTRSTRSGRLQALGPSWRFETRPDSLS